MFLLYLTFLNWLGYVILDADVIEMVKWKDVERSGCGLHSILSVGCSGHLGFLCRQTVESGENFLFIRLCC